MRTRARFELAVMAAVSVAFAALLGLAFVTVGPPDTDSEGYLPVLIIWAVLSAPSLVAARILCRAWWRRDTRDGPERLLGWAAGLLPQARRDWGAAMVAELAEVRGPVARVRFAAGCARAALFPPSAGRGPLLAGAMTVAAAPTAGLAVGHALPAMQVFTVTFLVLVGALTALALSRPRHRPLRPASGPVITVAGLAGVAAAITLAAYVLVQDQPAERTLGAYYAVILAAFLACCLWLILAPPRALTTSRLARRTGLAAAGLLGVCFVWSARSGDVMATFVFLPPVVISFLGSAVAAAARRSFRAGVQTTVWTTLTGTLLVFACWLVEAVRLHRAEGALLLDGETLYPVGTNVTDAVFWVLVFVPAWGLLPFGVMGAAVGSRLPRRLPQLVR
ncbi:hypothetical protein [Streptomyces sp. NPDC054940]